MYPPEEQAVFEAAWRVLDNAMLISECQDFIGVLKGHGFELKKIEELVVCPKVDNCPILACKGQLGFFEVEYLVGCCNCDWSGDIGKTVHPKHDFSILLCPECHETIEPV